MPSSRASEWNEPGHQQTPDAGVQAPTPHVGDQAAEEQRLRAELDQVENRYKRALADLDNYRKRSERETDRRVQDAREAVLRDWLEALDSVERALRMEPEDPGLQAVLAQMEAILGREGVTRLGAAGERFDPQHHEAVAVRTSEELPDKTLVEVTRSGFARGEKVLRPAHVVVSQHERSG